MKLAPNTTLFCHPAVFFILFFLIANSFSVVAQSSNSNGKDVSIKNMLDSNESAGKTLSDNNIDDEYNVPRDEYERGQPRSAMAGYLRAMRSADLALASHYLDYRNLSEKTLNVGKEELARQLGVVLNRTLWVDLIVLVQKRKVALTITYLPIGSWLGEWNTKAMMLIFYCSTFLARQIKSKYGRYPTPLWRKFPVYSSVIHIPH